MKNSRMAMALLVLASLAVQAHALPVNEAESSPTPKRFFPLASARGETKAVHVVRPLRSDTAALNGGFMRIDRNTPRTFSLNRGPLIVTPQTGAAASGTVSVLRGHAVDDKPADAETTQTLTGPDSETASLDQPGVLGLFDDGTAPLGSFRDVLSGKVGAAVLASRFGWPLPATATQKLTSPFGMRADPFSGKPEFHGGIDIAAETGTPVLATAAGQITQVGDDGRYGRYITLRHADGSESHYGHLQSASVRAGQPVAAGQIIAALGATGRVTGPHLDYRISKNGAKIDPMQVLTPPTPALRVAAR